MVSVLVVGASRGLGSELVKDYAQEKRNTVYATTRSEKPDSSASNVHWIPQIDVGEEDAGPKLAAGVEKPVDIVIISAGYFRTETFDEPRWADEIKTYTTSAIGPVFLIHHLEKANKLAQHSKIILVSSESGSITLRHQSQGGGNYAHHASKSALNMVGKLLSLDLKEKGIAVGIIHPGFMRTEMTRGVGFDQFWETGGAVTPEVASKSLKDFIEEFNIDMTGEYWAPRGPRDIGTAEATLGKGLPTPLQLPW